MLKNKNSKALTIFGATALLAIFAWQGNNEFKAWNKSQEIEEQRVARDKALQAAVEVELMIRDNQRMQQLVRLRQETEDNKAAALLFEGSEEERIKNQKAVDKILKAKKVRMPRECNELSKGHELSNHVHVL